LTSDSQIVLDAFLDARVSHKETFRFQRLIASLNQPVPGTGNGDQVELWEWRISWMILVNALVAHSPDSRARMSLREELKRRGMDEIVSVRTHCSRMSLPPLTCLPSRSFGLLVCRTLWRCR
jgi:hypothetical protein